MGYRKDDCQYECAHPPWDYGSPLDAEPDLYDPHYATCMDICEAAFPQWDNLVGTIRWKDVRRAMAEGKAVALDAFRIG